MDEEIKPNKSVIIDKTRCTKCQGEFWEIAMSDLSYCPHCGVELEPKGGVETVESFYMVTTIHPLTSELKIEREPRSFFTKGQNAKKL